MQTAKQEKPAHQSSKPSRKPTKTDTKTATKNAKPARLNSGVVEIVDFGLSSGTLWTIDFETDANENIIYLP